MRNTQRHLILLAVLLAGYGMSLLVGSDRSPAAAHWPTSESVVVVEGWVVEPAAVHAWGKPEPGAIVERRYQHPAGTTAWLTLWTVPQPHAKTLLRKGPDRDLLGAGFSSETVPTGVLPLAEGQGALVARRGAERWLALYAYGEQRGLLGNSPQAWGLATVDALLDRPNDYFIARILVRWDDTETHVPVRARELADVLFPRLAAWYAAGRALERPQE